MSNLAACLEQIIRVGERCGWALNSARVQQADAPICPELRARAPSTHSWRHMKRTWQFLMHDERATAYESLGVSSRH